MSDSLTIVFSTKKINHDYVQHIKKSCALDDLEILSYENNGKYGLTKIYNEAIEKSKNDIILFVHDDIIFETPYWGKKLLKHFKRNPDYGIIGVAGSKNLLNGMWWSDKKSMIGIVNHTNGIAKWVSNYSEEQGNKIKNVVTIDGLFMAVNKKLIKHKFDESFDRFHFYDLSFCVPNFIDNVKIGVITDIRITHLSIGAVNKEWHEFKEKFEKKYADKFPIKI
jgi:hypothetical protein